MKKLKEMLSDILDTIKIEWSQTDFSPSDLGNLTILIVLIVIWIWF